MRFYYAIIEKKTAGELYMINGFHHIGLKVTDIEKSEEFYKDAFGLFPYRAWGEGDGKVVMLKAPGGMILELFAGGCDFLCA